MPQGKCVFTESLEAEYPFLKEDQQVGKVLCSICKSQFSIEHESLSDILQHIRKENTHLLQKLKLP
jgi:transcription elongation factor Elf1